MDQPGASHSITKMTVTLDKVAVGFAGAGLAICGGVLALAEKIAASPRLFELGIAAGAALFIGGGSYVLKDLFDGIVSSKERTAILKRARKVLLASTAAFIVCYTVVFWLLGITFKFQKDEQIASSGNAAQAQAQAQAASPKSPEEKKASPPLAGTLPRVEPAEKAPVRSGPKKNPEGDSPGKEISGREPKDPIASALGNPPAAPPPMVNNGATAAPRAEEPAKAPALATGPTAPPPMLNAPAVSAVRPRTIETISLHRNDPRAICGIQLMKVRPSSPLKPSPTGWLLYSDDFLASFSEQPLVLDQSFKINDCAATLKRIDPDGRWFEFEVLRQR